ncbi:MAG: deaminase [Candidatus Hodarchaeales archaeon]
MKIISFSKQEIEFMKKAIEISKNSVNEKDEESPYVGAILVKDNQIIAEGFRGKTGKGAHAEFGVLEKILDPDVNNLADAILYTTLEPCTYRAKDKIPCSNRIINKGIKTVIIGMIDPNRPIKSEGMRRLRLNDVTVRLFPGELMREIEDINKDFIQKYKPDYWLPPHELRSLDDWYYVINAIYHDKNYQKSTTWLFSHLVEVIGGLSFIATKRKRKNVSAESYFPKILAWWFTLSGSLSVRSIEDLIWLKFPGVCSYCMLPRHDVRKCIETKKTSPNPNWNLLRQIGKDKRNERPRTMQEWKELFDHIYNPTAEEDYEVVFGRLAEELGELAESIRVIDIRPNSFISEIVDVFAWLMHFINLIEIKEDVKFDLSELLYDRYPDRCKDCNFEVCSCPPLLPRTLKRIAHDGPSKIGKLDLKSIKNYFLDSEEKLERFNIGSKTVLIGNKELDINTEFIENAYLFCSILQQEIFKSGIQSKSAERINSSIQSILHLTASQRVSQRIINNLLVNFGSLSGEEKVILKEVINKITESEFKNAIWDYLVKFDPPY